jgi:propanediol dehydratase small subunit
MKYPLYDSDVFDLRLPDGRPVSDLDVDQVMRGDVGAGDLGIREDVLREQAAVAEEAGFRPLAENLRRAAELVCVSQDEILAIYEALRPGRADADKLDAIARRLETEFGAELTAAFVREAADERRDR